MHIAVNNDSPKPFEARWRLAYGQAAIAVMAYNQGEEFSDLNVLDESRDLKSFIPVVTYARDFHVCVGELAGAKALSVAVDINDPLTDEIKHYEADTEAIARTLGDLRSRFGDGSDVDEAAEQVERYWPAIAVIGGVLLDQGTISAWMVRHVLRPVFLADKIPFNKLEMIAYNGQPTDKAMFGIKYVDGLYPDLGIMRRIEAEQARLERLSTNPPENAPAHEKWLILSEDPERGWYDAMKPGKSGGWSSTSMLDLSQGRLFGMFIARSVIDEALAEARHRYPKKKITAVALSDLDETKLRVRPAA
jgi:hypothetical protein